MGSQTKLDRRVSPCYLRYGTLVTALGIGIDAHRTALRDNQSGIHRCAASGFAGQDLFLGKIEFLQHNRYDHLLQIACDMLSEQVADDVLQSPRTRVIVSSTKGNMMNLPQDTFGSTRSILQQKWGLAHPPVIVSNACVSGVIAINLAADWIEAGKCDDVIIMGVDVLSDFILFGFQSLFALSDEPCRPFDIARKGISIGEACGIVILSNRPGNDFCVAYMGGASANDANHISGPSPIGEGLVRTVNRALRRSAIAQADIDYISAHGTGTLFNDDMESMAFDRLGLSHIPLNSFKAYIGHTLGAAGIAEVIFSMISMEGNQLFKSLGITAPGTVKNLNVVRENEEKNINIVLKTASGFGGTNAALLLKKIA